MEALDTDDLRLVRALQLAPRASLARLADALGIHERTAARRYRRLRREGVLRIFGMINPLAAGHQLWQVRVRCRPDAAQSLAVALAAREDVAWVGVMGAGAEVSFSVRSPSAEQRDVLLTRRLPRSAQVLDIDASLVLHVFLGLGSGGWSAGDALLTAEEVVRLTEDATAAETAPVPLEPDDGALLDVLAADGRATTARLAAAAGVSEGRAARRLAALFRTGTLVVDVDLAHEAMGVTAGAQLHLRVEPGRLTEVGRALARLPEVGFVAAMSGRDNLTASVACRDVAHLYELTSGRVGVVEGVAAMEVVPFARVVKQSGGLVVDGRLVEPA